MNDVRSLYELELECPPLPRTMLEAIELMEATEPPAPDEVTGMVQHDPAVVARVLRVVNSAYYARRGHINDIRHAVVVLGPASVVGVVMSMGMMSLRSALDAHTAAPFLNLVRHSIATGFLARHLVARAPETPTGDIVQAQGIAFTAGLMHDFGKLILLYNFPERGATFYGRTVNVGVGAAEILDMEGQLFGHDHVEVGVYLAQRLKFPEDLAEAISRHHTARDAERGWLDLAVTVANEAANAFGFQVNVSNTWVGCKDDAVWEELAACLGYDDATAVVEELQAVRSDLEDYVDVFS